MRNFVTAVFLSLSLLSVSPVYASPAADISRNEVVLNFPETVTFKLDVSATSEIQSVVLEYGNEQQTCGEVIAKAYPIFTPGTSVSTEWTWEMRQSGSLPPGSQLWWRWHITDSSGNETVTAKKTATWLDDTNRWQTVSEGTLYLHWYGKDRAFAQKMLDAGMEGLDRNEKDAGLTTDAPINVYVYPNYDDLREAILYESSWVGGQAFPDENIVIMGASETDSGWDESTVIHELTHVLVGHLTFSCLSYVPQWLNEGLAVYSEGPLDPQFKTPLDEAIQDDTLLSVRSISDAFSEVASKADLSYAQSYSLTNFLIETYGHEKMTALLIALRDGMTADDALQRTYGFNIDGLEDAWRAAIGAEPRTVSAQPTARPTPTFVPTIVPVSGGSFTGQATTTPIPTSTFGEQPTETPTTERGRPPLWLTLTVLGFCCIFLLVIGVVALGLVVRSQNRKGGNNG